MRFTDISHDKATTYRLTEREPTLFFMLNRSGSIDFELAAEGATAHIFAFFTGTDDTEYSLSIRQRHLAPRTTSSSLIKSALSGTARLKTESLIRIERDAHGTKAAHESRSLLLSTEAQASARPALEILADEVACHHAATTSPLNSASRLYAMSRGLTPREADELLIRGFFGEALERMAALGVATDSLAAALFQQLHTLYARG